MLIELNQTVTFNISSHYSIVFVVNETYVFQIADTTIKKLYKNFTHESRIVDSKFQFTYNIIDDFTEDDFLKLGLNSDKNLNTFPSCWSSLDSFKKRVKHSILSFINTNVLGVLLQNQVRDFGEISFNFRMVFNNKEPIFLNSLKIK
jgi:hypothetical protein